MKNNNKVSRSDFRDNRNGNRDMSGIIAKIGASKRKAESIEGGFTPSLNAEDLNGQTVEGRIVKIEDWQHGKKSGTTMHLENGGTAFRIPLYGVIEKRLARYQKSEELNRKKVVGLTVRLTCLGYGEAKKGQSAPALFDVAVVQ